MVNANGCSPNVSGGGGPRDECLGCGRPEVGGDGARKDAAEWLLELVDVRIIDTGGKKGYEELVKTGGGGPDDGGTSADCEELATEGGAVIEKPGRRFPVAGEVLERNGLGGFTSGPGGGGSLFDNTDGNVGVLLCPSGPPLGLLSVDGGRCPAEL